MASDRLAAVIVTLNKIETHGKENMKRLLACIQALEEIREEVSLAEQNPTE